MKGKEILILSFLVLLIGIISNNLVVAKNNCMMPVKDFDGIQNKFPSLFQHTYLTDKTKYPYLSDIFFGASIGDFFLLSGILLMWWGVVKDD